MSIYPAHEVEHFFNAGALLPENTGAVGIIKKESQSILFLQPVYLFQRRQISIHTED